MKIIKLLKKLAFAKTDHFLYVDYKYYERWKYPIRLSMFFNKEYKTCEIYRKGFKKLNNFVVVGLKYSGKNVKRRTMGYAKNYILKNPKTKCLYCEETLTIKNATADHIVPISNGGNNTQVNLLVCCRFCNEDRGNMGFVEYLEFKNIKIKTKFI